MDNPHPPRLDKTTHGYIDSQAKLARLGDEGATSNSVTAVLQSAGIDPAVARAFGFQERLVQAQLAYVKGQQTGIREADIVSALNNLGSTLNTPQWSRTNAAEVRRVRVMDLVYCPDLLLSHVPVSNGQTPHLIEATMGPLEAIRIAVSLIHQKIYNTDLQVTKAEGDSLGMYAARQLGAQRGQEFRGIVFSATGQKSIRDLLWVADAFLNDLKVNPIAHQRGAL